MEEAGKAAQLNECCDGLSQLKLRFGHWRAGRKAGERIPPELWAGAASAAVEHGACRVAADLRLDYTALKRRAAALAGTATPAAALAPRFVELFAPAAPVLPAAAARPACVVEMGNARGAKMRLELDGSGLAQLSALCGAFWAA
jgi:hypothetical protein